MFNDVSDKNEALKKERANARSWAFRSVDNNINNLVNDQMNDYLASYAAFGGKINRKNKYNMGGFKTSGLIGDLNTSMELPSPEEQYQMYGRGLLMPGESNVMGGKGPDTFTWANGGRLFDIGGDLQTHGADWSTGLSHIDAGGSHEESPYDGVQMGMDPEGTPNLVEEGETVYDDYVFSNRILADEATKQMFKLPKKRDITFADISKKLEKEIAEHPNDPISEAGFKAQMQQLEEQQERQKQEMEAERAKAAFEALTPEEKVAVMENAAQQEAIAQQAAQEQAIAEQQAMQQATPEELAMAEQVQQQADGSNAALGQPAPEMAEGGRLFDKGGDLKKLIYKMLPNIHTDSDFEKFAKENNIDTKSINWEKALENKALIDAVSKDNPALKDAISKGYDFGAYIPGNVNTVSFDDDRGNWDAQTVQGWWGSNDPAWRQVIEAHPELTEDTKLSREQLADYLRNTDAFKRGTQWLQESEDNRLAYLQRIINNPKAPSRAREYAEKFADSNGWKKDAARDYETIFNNPSGRAANPGTYWKTPIEAVRGKQTGNFVINNDGTVEEIIGDIPTDWTSAGDYSWATPENDIAYRYYRRPTTSTEKATVSTQSAGTASASDGENTSAEKKARGVRPDLRRETSLGMFGPLVNLGMMFAGVGKPDTRAYDAAVRGAGNVRLAGYDTIGNRLTYKPLDIWFAQNRADALSRATDRNILNTSGGNRGTAMAGLLANGLDSQIANGNLFRQGVESNLAQEERRETFNRDTDKYNADAYTRNSMFNASAMNDAMARGVNARLHAAQVKDDANRWWASNLYGNVNSLFDRVNQWEKWKRDHNTVARMAADSLFGNMSDQQYIGDGYLKPAAEGGKIKRKKNKKRGLTF